jgi:hypothetical protein
METKLFQDLNKIILGGKNYYNNKQEQNPNKNLENSKI